MKKTAFLIMILAILVKTLGFAREITLSYYYGASSITDAYLISLTIPGTIFAFIGIGLATGFIPMFSNIVKEEGNENADKFTNDLTKLLLIISTFIILLVLVFATPIVLIFASGFKEETLKLAVLFTRIGILNIGFSVLIYVFSSYLQIKNNFVIPALMGIPINLMIICSIIFSSEYGVIYLSIGSSIAVLLQFLFILPFIYRSGFKFSARFEVKNKYVIDLLKLSIPVIIGVSVNQINVLVDRTIASQIIEGGISTLTYANRLNQFIEGIFVLSLATALFPIISKLASENHIIELKKRICEAIGIINLVVVPATIGAIIFAEPIVIILFGRGAFDIKAISLTSYALVFYSIGMVAVGMREILSRTFYALQDTKTPMLNATIALCINIVLNLIFSRFMGIGGLALATSIAAIICTLLLFISLRKKIGPFGMKKISISFLKILFASLVMGLISRLSFNYITANIFSQNLSLLMAIGIGAIIYFVMIYFMNIEDVDVIVGVIKRKLKKEVS